MTPNGMLFVISYQLHVIENRIFEICECMQSNLLVLKDFIVVCCNNINNIDFII